MLTEVLLALAAGAVVATGADFDASVDTALREAKDIYVATQRRDGTRSAAAPVWFMYDGDAIYFSTLATSHKAKRLRHGGRVWVAVGSAEGPSVEGHGSLVVDPELTERMAEHYRRKYWIAWLGFFRPNKDRVAAGRTVIVKVVPTTARAATQGR
jgi:PPOX class probable F420-dependent enzyme